MHCSGELVALFASNWHAACYQYRMAINFVDAGPLLGRDFLESSASSMSGGAFVSATWVDLAGVLAAVFSTVTAVVALIVAIRSDRRSRQALKVQTYLQLRGKFLDIFQQLGRLDRQEDEGIEVTLARQAYWHHAWDEFYVAKRLAPDEFATLWDDFFRPAVKSGLHEGLVQTLNNLASDRSVGFGAYAQDLVAEVRQMEEERRKG